jgi:hypothetical protein
MFRLTPALDQFGCCAGGRDRRQARRRESDHWCLPLSRDAYMTATSATITAVRKA